MNKLVIFDLDGTLLDTLPDITDSINVMLKEFGYKTITDKETRRFVGNGARNLVKRSIEFNGYSLTESELDERLKFYNEYYTKSNSPKTKLFDGVSIMLKELKRRGYKLAVLTNKPQMTTDNVNGLYLKEFGFDTVIGSSNGIKIKPDPTTTLEIMNRLNVLPENTFFVGDGETDVKTAINANVKGVAVLWGYRDKADLLKAGANIFASKPFEILNVIL